jgi:hypothetical protein
VVHFIDREGNIMEGFAGVERAVQHALDHPELYERIRIPERLPPPSVMPLRLTIRCSSGHHIRCGGWRGVGAMARCECPCHDAALDMPDARR